MRSRAHLGIMSAAVCDRSLTRSPPSSAPSLPATVATWNFKSVVHNAGPKSGYTDSLTIVKDAHLTM